MKKKVALLLAFFMIFANVTLAAGNSPSKKLHTSKNPVATAKSASYLLKKEKLDKQYSDNDKVRIVVELDDAPAISYAQKKGVKFNDLPKATQTDLKQDVLSAQKSVKKAISKKAVKVNYKDEFTTAFNGFSGETTYKSVKAIESLPNVAAVHIVNEYARPDYEKGSKPHMISSKDLVNAKQEWETHGYDGEGMVVAVIDTGTDTSHKDMVLTDASKAKLTPAKVEQLAKDKKLSGKYYTPKVPYAYNYADRNSEIRDLGPGASMHGMHVAGTVGANGNETNGGIKGVAPEAQILGMKVFGNDPGMPSTFGDIYIKAIDDAVILGADVINMSLGSTASFVIDEDPEQQAIANASNSGVLFAISAGNSATFGDGWDDPYASNPDIGVVGAPGLTNESLQVASLENSNIMLDGFKLYVDGVESGYIAYQKQDTPNPLDIFNGKTDVVYVGDGQPQNYEGKDVKGKLVMAVRTGSYFYANIQKTAEEKGAAGVIVRGTVAHGDYVNMALDNPKLPMVSLSIKDGNTLQSLIGEGKGLAVEFDGKQVSATNPTGGTMSTFTSWGVTPNLDFKPEITAPGGKIYSTLNNNEYGVMSGTSMAAPHVAGGSAIVLQRVDKDFKLKGAERVQMAKNILMNTASPRIDKGLYNNYYKLNNYYSPRRAGSGLMDLMGAVETPVVVTNSKTGVAKVALKEISGKTATFTLTAKNYSNKDVTYNVEGNVQTDLVTEGDNLREAQAVYKASTYDAESGTGEYPIDITSTKGKDVDGSYQVTVPAKGTSSIEVTLDLSDVAVWNMEADTIEELFPNGYFVEGLVRLVDVEGKLPSLSVPYVGFKGNWSAAPIIDDLASEETSFYGSTGLVTDEINEDSSGSTTYFKYLGVNPVDEKLHKDKIAFSPNGDGVNDNIYPAVSFLRNAKQVSYAVLDAKKQRLKKLRSEEYVVKNYFDGGSGDTEYVVNNADWDGNTSDGLVKDGKYFYEIKSIIDYPNAKWQTKHIPFYVDTQKPGVSSSKLDGAKLSWKASDATSGISHIDIRVNGKSVLTKPLAASVTTYQLTSVPGAKDKVEVLIYDYAGNKAITKFNAKPDKTVPSVFVVTPEALTVTDYKKVMVTGYVEDESEITSVKVNGHAATVTWNEAKQRYDFGYEIVYTKDGVYDFRVESTDAAGNKTSFLRKVFIDSTSATINVKAPSKVSEYKRYQTVSIELEDNFSDMRFYINGDEKYANTFKEPFVMKTHKHKMYTTLKLNPGWNTFKFKLVDLGGNVTEKTVKIYRDNK